MTGTGLRVCKLGIQMQNPLALGFEKYKLTVQPREIPQ